MVAGLVVGLVGSAHADRWQGGAWMHYELTGLTTRDEAAASAEQLVLGGVRLHGFLSTNASVAVHVGVDLGFGSTLGDAGFAYDVALFPLGVVLRVGKTSIFSLGTGIGGMGAVGTLDDALTLPVELTVELGIGRRLRLLSRTRITYNALAATRQSAADNVPFADELDAMFGVRIGRYYDDYGFPSGNGYFVGASYRELAGAQMIGLTIGYSIDLAMPRRWAEERQRERKLSTQ
ncbi:MAG TPA: hypothetical protein VK427_14050 [Kofleriaceae bacterium]|nr:hypothetical protein [Kofleriaceae bacterium]